MWGCRFLMMCCFLGGGLLLSDTSTVTLSKSEGEITFDEVSVSLIFLSLTNLHLTHPLVQWPVVVQTQEIVFQIYLKSKSQTQSRCHLSSI